jgi:hypothetical protein
MLILMSVHLLEMVGYAERNMVFIFYAWSYFPSICSHGCDFMKTLAIWCLYVVWWSYWYAYGWFLGMLIFGDFACWMVYTDVKLPVLSRFLIGCCIGVLLNDVAIPIQCCLCGLVESFCLMLVTTWVCWLLLCDVAYELNRLAMLLFGCLLVGTSINDDFDEHIMLC